MLRTHSPLFLLLVLMGGCSVQGGRAIEASLAPFGLASTVAVDHDSRWRLPPDSPVSLIAVTPAPHTDWARAAVAGLQSRFPIARAVPSIASSAGLTVYVQWPDAEPAPGEVAPSAIASIPSRAWDFIRHTPSTRIGVVCVDNVSRTVVHRAQLRVHESWQTAWVERSELIRSVFARYAMALASG